MIFFSHLKPLLVAGSSLFFFTALERVTASDAPKVSIESTKVISHQPNLYHGWPTLLRRHDGELVLVYSGGRDTHVCPLGRVEMTTSRDNGTTWSWPRVLIDSVTDDRDAGIVETAKGTLVVVFFTATGYLEHMTNPEFLEKAKLKGDIERWKLADIRSNAEEKKQDVGNWMIRSTDGGLTWSHREAIPCNSPHGPIALADGRLLYLGKAKWTDEEKVGAWESKDDGVTWSMLAEIPARPSESVKEYHELHAVETADGTIIAQIRNHNTEVRQTLQSESKDGGKTWSVPHEIGVFGYPTHLLRLKNNTLVMTYSWRKKPYGIRGRISTDNGASWSGEFILSQDGATWDLGYPSTIQLDDGRLLTAWYESQADTNKAALRLATWKLE